MANRPWTNADEQQFRALVAAGKTQAEIVKLMGRTFSTIHWHWKKYHADERACAPSVSQRRVDAVPAPAPATPPAPRLVASGVVDAALREHLLRLGIFMNRAHAIRIVEHCREQQQLEGCNDAFVTLLVRGTRRGRRARLYPGGPIGEVLSHVNGRTVLGLKADQVIAALERALQQVEEGESGD